MYPECVGFTKEAKIFSDACSRSHTFYQKNFVLLAVSQNCLKRFVLHVMAKKASNAIVCNF